MEEKETFEQIIKQIIESDIQELLEDKLTEEEVQDLADRVFGDLTILVQDKFWEIQREQEIEKKNA